VLRRRAAAGAKDLRSVLFNWTWAMGIAGLDEHELIASLEYQGKGTIQLDGQPFAQQKGKAHKKHKNIFFVLFVFLPLFRWAKPSAA
jgi:hypothetical protein